MCSIFDVSYLLFFSDSMSCSFVLFAYEISSLVYTSYFQRALFFIRHKWFWCCDWDFHNSKCCTECFCQCCGWISCMGWGSRGSLARWGRCWNQWGRDHSGLQLREDGKSYTSIRLNWLTIIYHSEFLFHWLLSFNILFYLYVFNQRGWCLWRIVKC